MLPTLSDLELMARGAGAIVRQGYQPRPGFENHLHVEYKGVVDPVTESDHQAEAYLLEEIQRRFPEHMVETEESGHLAGDRRFVWYLDPIDGTINFAHGLPFFVVSIAFALDGKMQMGAIYDPISDEMYTAQHGQGAWLNHQPIRVTSEARLERSLLSTGFPFDVHTNPANNLTQNDFLMVRTQGVIHIGAVAMDLCYLAAGRLDGTWQLRLRPWDIAAGGLIAEEAGAVVTSVQGDPDYMQPPYSILAANPAIHPQILRIFQRLEN